MSSTYQVAFTSARALLNDNNGQLWNNITLMPYMQEAYRDMLLQLWLNGIPIISEKAADFIVNAGTISLNSAGLLPTDLFEPIWLKERAAGSSEDWQGMAETDFEPDVQQELTLRYWTWRKDDIKFVGATTARSVRMQYTRSLNMPTNTDGSDSIGWLFGEMFLGPQCAGYAAGSVGNVTLSQELIWQPGVTSGVAAARFDQVLRANIKGRQNLPARRVPYRRFARSRLLL